MIPIGFDRYTFLIDVNIQIKLEGCHRLTDTSLIALARSCPLLLEMDLAQVQQLSNATVYGIFLNTTHLRELKLNGHNYLTDSAFPNLADLRDASDDELVDSAGRYADIVASLTHAGSGSGSSSKTALRASIPGEKNGGNELNERIEGNEGIPGYLPSRRKSSGNRDLVIRPPKPELLRPVLDVFEHLRIVDLTSCSAIGDRAVDNLITNAPKLRSLTLNKCSNLTDRTVESVCRLGKHLHYLHLGHVSS
jgi:F-box and leucine-rich repeat protein GRR1